MALRDDQVEMLKLNIHAEIKILDRQQIDPMHDNNHDAIDWARNALMKVLGDICVMEKQARQSEGTQAKGLKWVEERLKNNFVGIKPDS